MDDGSTQRLTLPVEIWFGGRPLHRDRARAAGRWTRVTVDPDATYPDVRRENNRWPAAASRPSRDTLSGLHRLTCHSPLSMSLA